MSAVLFFVAFLTSSEIYARGGSTGVSKDSFWMHKYEKCKKEKATIIFSVKPSEFKKAERIFKKHYPSYTCDFQWYYENQVYTDDCRNKQGDILQRSLRVDGTIWVNGNPWGGREDFYKKIGYWR